MLPPDVYAQPDAPDPVLPDAAVLAIVRRFVPGARAVAAVDESGGEARAYAIDDDVVLKVQRPQQLRSRTSLEKEAFFLRALAADAEISVPRVLGYGREPVEFICMTRMPGVAAGSVDLTGEQRGIFLRDLGRTLRRIHSLPQQQFLEGALFPGVKTGGQFVERAESVLSEFVEAVVAGRILWDLPVAPWHLAPRVLASLPATIDLVALHSNPGPEHAFIDPLPRRFSGLIDFGDAYIGHPGFDMRWPSYADNLMILKGYQDEGPVGLGFLATWNAVQVLADLSNLLRRPERRDHSLARLRAIIENAFQ